jgi:plasmid stability protein
MAQVIVRNIEDSVKRKLQRRAARHGRSMEEEAREILRDALKDEDAPRKGLGSAIAARFRGLGFIEEIPKLKIHPRIPKFD